MGNRKKVAVPTNLEEANLVLAQIGEHQRELDIIVLAADTAIASVASVIEGAQKEAAPHEKEVHRLWKNLLAFAKKHPAEIMEDGKKSRKLPAGEIGLRLSPEAVHVARGKEDEVFARIHELDLAAELLRVVEELDRDAVKKHRGRVAEIDGLSIRQDEVFFAKPDSCASEVTGNASTGRLSERARWKKKA